VVVHRKQSPKVKDGRVQKKNNWEKTAHYSQVKGLGFVIDRERPGKGYRHLLLKDQVERFISLLPDWDELSIGLDALVLAPGGTGAHGWHDDGLIAISAWPREMTETVDPSYATEHSEVVEQLSVTVQKEGPHVLLQWTDEKARAFQLLHIFLHELGHHHDQMASGGRQTSQGEGYAERYAHEHARRIFKNYIEEFGIPV
jgi:hypothetical protein